MHISIFKLETLDVLDKEAKSDLFCQINQRFVV